MTLAPLLNQLALSHPDLSKTKPNQVFFAPSNTQVLAIAGWVRAAKDPQTLVTATSKSASELAQTLTDLVPNLEIIEFPSWETLPHERLSPAADTVGKRLRALHRMLEVFHRTPEHPVLILMSIRAALQKVVGGLEDHPPFTLIRGKDYLLPELSLKLIELAYERVDMVTRRGEYAIRGGILDVFPTTSEHALRLEFFGDQLDDIREFTVADQRSIDSRVNEIELYAAREMLITPSVAQKAREMAHEFPNLSEMLEKISNGIVVEGMESLAPVLASKLGSITEYLGKKSNLILVEPEKLASRAQSLIDTNNEFLHAAWDAAISGSNAPIDLSGGGFYELEEFLDTATKCCKIIKLDSLGVEGSIDLGLKEIPKFADESSVLDWISDLRVNQNKILISAQGHGTGQRLLEILTQANIPVILTEHLGDITKEHVTIAVGSLSHGFAVPESKIVVLTDSEFFGVATSYSNPKERKLAKRRGAEVDPLTLKQGDYVVHEIHGIGRFKELVQRTSGVGQRQHSREYLLIEYASPKRGYPGDTLYVPTDQLDMLTRYVGGEAPVLSKMGGTDWAKAKGNARKAVRKIAIDLVKLYSARMKSKGHAFPPDTPWQQELEDAFIFQETPDQLTTIDEVKRDMEKPMPMDRLLAGDVGYGKTEVAVRAAFKAIQDGKQVAILVPTTLLVRQHLDTFTSRYQGFPISIKPLSRFQTEKEVKETLRGVENGGVDLIIGTHRLLGAGVKFKDLGLVIIDEEQRFGVEHKEKLKDLKHNVDVLAMSATPIPRTLEMAVTGIREMSTLATAPEERHPILTYIGGYSEGQVAAAIRRELIRDGQVFFVHNRVATIDGVAADLARLVPEARIAIAHGQMPEHQLEQVVVDFWQRKFDVLVSTTIIETGIDIPNANTLIVDRAENFGLSQLHQIRGRVGRSRERAYAYFFYDPSKTLTETAHDRLATIATNNELGSGMQVAMKDLEIRGAGNLLGGEQSGHIAGVGFDLYLRMIGEAVAEFKGEDISSPAELKLELPVDAHIPAEYVDSERLRLEAYHKLSAESSGKSDKSKLDAIFAELEDRYGKAPDPVRNLIEVTHLRQQANRLGLKDVNLLGLQSKFAPIELTDSEVVALSHKIPGFRYLQTSKLVTLPSPTSAGLEPLRDQEVIDWLWKTFQILFGDGKNIEKA
ncbi:MAG: transcription-repair coupling factor [Aquiluna sp.]|nr:transcription-repair coupling factor [Aquiluna sp.]MCF8545384.1 transcription-repair coupling factor [Aquiluna sp.]